MNRKEFGNKGEEAACGFLIKKGYKILARNWRNKWAEIDIVAEKAGVLVFVEVKTINEKENYFPEDEIDQRKERQLVRACQMYLEKEKINPETPYQIDIVAITETGLGKEIAHFENVIEDNY